MDGGVTACTRPQSHRGTEGGGTVLGERNPCSGLAAPLPLDVISGSSRHSAWAWWRRCPFSWPGEVWPSPPSSWSSSSTHLLRCCVSWQEALSCLSARVLWRAATLRGAGGCQQENWTLSTNSWLDCSLFPCHIHTRKIHTRRHFLLQYWSCVILVLGRKPRNTRVRMMELKRTSVGVQYRHERLPVKLDYSCLLLEWLLTGLVRTGLIVSGCL